MRALDDGVNKYPHVLSPLLPATSSHASNMPLMDGPDLRIQNGVMAATMKATVLVTSQK